MAREKSRPILSFQSLSRDSGRLNAPSALDELYDISEFQSLSRDSGRLNDHAYAGPFVKNVVSIPQSGFGAFEQKPDPQRSQTESRVSIPQSGFGAFEPDAFGPPDYSNFAFQSLSRDSGRLNMAWSYRVLRHWRGFQSLSRDSGRLNQILALATPKP